MREYAKVSPQFWTRGSGKRLRGDADAQVLAMYVVTCPSANMIGIYYVPIVSIAHETGLGESRTRAALERLKAAGFAFYDFDTELVWVPRMAAYQLGDDTMKPGDKRRSGVRAEAEKVGRCPFMVEFWRIYGEAYCLGEYPWKGSHDSSQPLRRGCAQVGEEQESEQESEQEQEQEGAPAAPATPPAGSKASRATRLPDGWTPRPETIRRFATKERVDATAAIEPFCLHFQSAPGAKALKTDWEKAFTGWVLRDLHKLPPYRAAMPKREPPSGVIRAAPEPRYEPTAEERQLLQGLIDLPERPRGQVLSMADLFGPALEPPKAGGT